MNRAFLRTMPFFLGLLGIFASCKKNSSSSTPTVPKDPNTTAQASIDRFSSAAGHLQVRTASNGLPAVNAAVNFDQAPFITRGFTPTGSIVDYYNFDVQSTTPAPIWVFFKEGQTTPIPGQNIIDVIPGDAGYNDFWQVYKVTVPADYVANTVTSYQEIVAKGYPIAKMTDLVNCPVVPKGSTASKRYTGSGDAGLTQGWYKDQVVYYFNFFEKTLSVNSNGQVPLSPIYVTFNINPNQPNGGPASGFKMEPGSVQTHNVIGTIPTNAGYSPLWVVAAYDNSSFNTVKDLSTATAAPILVPNAGYVNCPVVNIQ
ncbi:MAG TPA: hypothetical protein VF939_08665 [Puia sp.]